MYIIAERLSSFEEDRRTAIMNRSRNCSVSEERGDQEERALVEIESRKKHRRGKKRCRPKWKPYSKMSLEERKQVDEWEAQHVAIREAEINARSKRPVAPFNSTQFLIEDRDEDQCLGGPRPLRTRSYESSSSGDEEHYEPLEGEEDQQEAFIEADFNQVYLQLQLNRLEGMTKQDLITQCCSLEDKVSSIEQEKLELVSQLKQLEKANGKLLQENSQLKEVESGGAGCH